MCKGRMYSKALFARELAQLEIQMKTYKKAKCVKCYGILLIEKEGEKVLLMQCSRCGDRSQAALK